MFKFSISIEKSYISIHQKTRIYNIYYVSVCFIYIYIVNEYIPTQKKKKTIYVLLHMLCNK